MDERSDKFSMSINIVFGREYKQKNHFKKIVNKYLSEHVCYLYMFTFGKSLFFDRIMETSNLFS